jgi:hypothetical protein
MPDQPNHGTTSDDAAIFSLNRSSNDDDKQPDGPFKDARDAIVKPLLPKAYVKSGGFVPSNPLFKTTPGAKNVQW